MAELGTQPKNTDIYGDTDVIIYHIDSDVTALMHIYGQQLTEYLTSRYSH